MKLDEDDVFFFYWNILCGVNITNYLLSFNIRVWSGLADISKIFYIWFFWVFLEKKEDELEKKINKIECMFLLAWMTMPILLL